MKKVLFVLFLFIFSFSLGAQENTTTQKKKEKQKESSKKEKKDNIVDLSKMSVKGDVLSGDKSAYGVTRVDSKQIEDLKVSRTGDLIAEIPGMSVSEYNQGGISNAFILRGFSSGIHGGDMGVYLDGIPLNEYYGHGGGYADVNVLIPLELDKILLYKGPSSALYGNFSRGGTVAFYTKKKDEYTQVFTRYGSYNTVDAQGTIGFKAAKNLWNNTALQIYSADGYTENSSHLYGNASTRFTWDVLPNLELSLSLRAHSAKWDAPGYITRTQWNDSANWYKQDSNIGNDGGERIQTSERFDLNYGITKDLHLLYWAFALQSKWTRWATFYDSGSGTYPQTQKDYAIGKYGTGASISFKKRLAKYLELATTGGIEYYADDTRYQKYSTTSRAKTAAASENIHTTFHNLGIFLEGEFNIVQYFKPVVGVRADLFAGTEEDFVNSTVESFAMNKYYHISPKAGFVSTLVKDILDFRFNFSDGYQMPPADVMNANTNVSPSEILQYEAGFTTKYKKYIVWNISGYLIDTTNEIQETTSGSGVYINVGKTRRMGIETDISSEPVKGLNFTGSLTYTHSEVLYSTTVTAGKALTTIPWLKTKLGAKYLSPIGLGLQVDWQFVGESFTNSANTETAPAYHLLNAGVFYNIKHKGKVYTINVDFKNITNSHYATYASGTYFWTTGAPFTFNVSLNFKF